MLQIRRQVGFAVLAGLCVSGAFSAHRWLRGAPARQAKQVLSEIRAGAGWQAAAVWRMAAESTSGELARGRDVREAALAEARTKAVEGCAVDQDASAPWGRAVIDPSARTRTLHVRWPDENVVYPAVLDPRWTATGSMTTARQGHTATLLSAGKVLVAGGTSNGTSNADKRVQVSSAMRLPVATNARCSSARRAPLASRSQMPCSLAGAPGTGFGRGSRRAGRPRHPRPAGRPSRLPAQPAGDAPPDPPASRR